MALNHCIGMKESLGQDGLNDSHRDAPGIRRPAKGDCPALRREREKRALRKALLAADLARLVCLQKRSFKEAAAELGVSYRHCVGNLWPMAKKSTTSDILDPAEKERIGIVIAESLQQIVRTAMDKLGDSAVYGTVAINGCKQLIELYGINFQSTTASNGATNAIDEIAESVLDYAPLLASQLDKIQRIRQRQAEGAAL